MKKACSGVIVRVAVLAVALGALLVAPSVAAANPACGTTLTQNVTLTSDMNCPSSSGIVVGKAGITINLNGHKIIGPSAGYVGIDNSGGYDHVTLENGTIAGFNYDVYYQHTRGSKILHISAMAAHYDGIAYWYSRKGVVDHSTGSGAGDYGIYLYENKHVNVTNSKAPNNVDAGIYDYHSLSTLENVTVYGNNQYGVYVEKPLAYSSSKGTAYYTIKNSKAHNNSTGFDIRENFPTSLYQAKLVDNTANDNGAYGFNADRRTKGKGNHATGNGTQNCRHVPCG